MHLDFLLIYFILCGISCARNPYRHTNKMQKLQIKRLVKELKTLPSPDSLQAPRFWTGTTNFGLRKPNFVIIHHTAQKSCDQTLRTFILPRTQVSAHYVICKDGTVHHMLNDYFRAWHGGVSLWGNSSDINSASIGIELDNDGFEIFPEPQLNSLLRVLNSLKLKYQIPIDNFLGHADIAPTRKVDPNIFFPWKMLAERGFGNWYDDTSGIFVPPDFDNTTALRIIGYSIKDTTAAIGAFKRHFMQDSIRILNDHDKKVLYLLSEKIKNQ